VHGYAPSAAPRPHSPRYLTAMKGRCLNCLSSSHKRVDYCLPTCCFNCHGLRHHLQDYKRPRKSSTALRDSEASHGTLSSLGDRGTSSALESAPSEASSFLEPDHIFSRSSVCFISRSWDPMVAEAALGASAGVSFLSCQEEVVGMVEQLAYPPLAAMSPDLSSLLPSVEDMQTPMVFRSEEEQLVGHKLFKALRNFKLSTVPSLSPSSHHESPSNNEANVVLPKGLRVVTHEGKLKSNLEN
jgi:hypothetical protein